MFPEWTPYLQKIKLAEHEQRLRAVERRSGQLSSRTRIRKAMS